MRNKACVTAEEITKMFMEGGWSDSTAFSELTLEEAKDKGYLFAISGISKGHKYFVMNVSGNIYDDKGNLVMLNVMPVKQ